MDLLPAPPTAQAAALTCFRARLHREVYGRWADALFELTDTVLCAPGAVNSMPHLKS